jgi:hypothetical protein
MYADYQELAAGFARECRERRAAQREQDELTKPVPSAVDVRKSNGAGLGLVFKTRDNARVDDPGSRIAHNRDAADDSSAVERRASAKSELTWWKWTDQRIDSRLEAFAVAAAEGMAEFVGKKVSPLKREFELLKREFTVLQKEVATVSALRRCALANSYDLACC